MNTSRVFLFVLSASTFACGAVAPDSHDAAIAPDAADSADAAVDASQEADAAPAPLGAMNASRALFGSALCDDGKVRVFSGYSQLVLLSSVESYDTTSNAWTKGSFGKLQRYAHAVTKGIDGSVYVVGGTGNGSTATGSVEVYSPATDGWSSIADLPTPRLGLGAATAKDGRIFAIGGGLPGNPTDVVEIYSPDTKSWTTGPSMPTARLSLQAVTGSDGLIYAIGGRDAQTTPLAVVEALDPVKGTWTTMPPMPTARYWFGATAAKDGRIYVAGGIGDLGFLDNAESFEIGGAWSKLPAMPYARGWLTLAGAADGRVLAIGGAEDTGAGQPPPVSTMFAYDPASKAWAQ